MNDNAERLRQLIECGWVELQGNKHVITAAGRAAIRLGRPGKSYGATLRVDSVRARTKPPIKKKHKRK